MLHCKKIQGTSWLLVSLADDDGDVASRGRGDHPIQLQTAKRPSAPSPANT